jgi:hypothetical protein
MFQKCPICEGSGEVPSNLLDTTCSVCKGEKIISTLTGFPPNRVQQFPSAIDPSVIGPHGVANPIDYKEHAKHLAESLKNSNWGLPDNTFAPAPTVYIRNPTDDKNLY